MAQSQQPDVFRKLKLLHVFMLSAFSLFILIMWILRGKGYAGATRGESFERAFQLVAVLVSAAFLLTGFWLFRKQLMQVRNSKGPAEKRMQQYMGACLVWWAMIEGAGLLSGIGFFLTGNHAFLALAIFHILVLLLFMPRKSNILVLLQLNSDEIARLEGK